MKWCVDFPEETVLVVRPSLKRICLGFKPAGKLLSTLLYRASIRKEAIEDAENHNAVKAAQGEEPDQDTSLRIYRTQEQLTIDMVEEMNEKTLHDVAIPTLQLLGYLDIEEYPGRNCYILHLDAVQQALTVLKEQKVKLEKFLISRLQLEKFLLDPELEKFLIDKKKFLLNKKYFLLQLEKVLIANRKISYCKRGRKPAPKELAEGQNEVPQNLKDNKEILESNKENIGAFAPTPSDVSLSESNHSGYEGALAYLTSHHGYEHIDKSHTPAEVIRLAQSVREQQAVAPPSESVHENDSHPEPPQQQALMAPSVRESAKVEPPAPPTPTKRRNKGIAQLTLAGQHIIDLYDASKPIKRKTRLNADNINCANNLGLAVESDDDFTRVVQRMRDDPFLKEKRVAIDLDFIDRKFEKFLTIVDQEQEAATQAEKARREAEARAKTSHPPTVVKPTALEQQMREMEARYLQGGK